METKTKVTYSEFSMKRSISKNKFEIKKTFFKDTKSKIETKKKRQTFDL